MKTKLCLLYLTLALALLAAPAPTQSGDRNPGQAIQRHHSVTGLKKEKAEYYIKLHAETWPGVLRMIKECHIQNYSIALKEIAGRLYLFSYFEYTGNDFEADMKRMAQDPETRRWWKETDPCQSPLPDAAAAGKIWSDAREVFFTP